MSEPITFNSDAERDFILPLLSNEMVNDPNLRSGIKDVMWTKEIAQKFTDKNGPYYLYGQRHGLVRPKVRYEESVKRGEFTPSIIELAHVDETHSWTLKDGYTRSAAVVTTGIAIPVRLVTTRVETPEQLSQEYRNTNIGTPKKQIDILDSLVADGTFPQKGVHSPNELTFSERNALAAASKFILCGFNIDSRNPRQYLSQELSLHTFADYVDLAVEYFKLTARRTEPSGTIAKGIGNKPKYITRMSNGAYLAALLILMEYHPNVARLLIQALSGQTADYETFQPIGLDIVTYAAQIQDEIFFYENKAFDSPSHAARMFGIGINAAVIQKKAPSLKPISPEKKKKDQKNARKPKRPDSVYFELSGTPYKSNRHVYYVPSGTDIASMVDNGEVLHNKVCRSVQYPQGFICTDDGVVIDDPEQIDLYIKTLPLVINVARNGETYYPMNSPKYAPIRNILREAMDKILAENKMRDEVAKVSVSRRKRVAKATLDNLVLELDKHEGAVDGSESYTEEA